MKGQGEWSVGKCPGKSFEGTRGQGIGINFRRSQASIEACKQTIRTKSGTGLFDFILEDLEQMKKTLFNPQCLGVITAAMNASLWINEKMYEWLGEPNAADTLSQSVPGNVTSEMGLALLDGTRFVLFWTDTACDAPAKSTSPERGGVKNRPP